MIQEDKNINNFLGYKFLLFIIGLAIAAILLFNLKGCKKEVDIPNHDTIYHAENIDNNILELALRHNKYLVKLNDSLMKRKPILIIRYKTKYDSLILTDTSCQSSLIMLYNAFGDLNDLNDSIIANNQKRLINDSLTIATLNHKIGLKQIHITIDSTRIVALIDTLPKVKRKGFFKGFKYGFISGVILTESANVGSKFIKP